MTDKLKTCPFCGGGASSRSHEPQWNKAKYNSGMWVRCNSCDCELGGYSTQEEAIKAWNTRTDNTQVLVEALEVAREALEDMVKCIKNYKVKTFSITNTATGETWKWHDEWNKYAQETLAKIKQAKE